MNSLLPKIDELNEMVKTSNPTVIGITETKLDNSIDDSAISIDRYCAIRRDRNRKGGGLICYVINKICYNTKNCISKEIEMSLSNFLFQKQNQVLLELFTNVQLKRGF